MKKTLASVLSLLYLTGCTLGEFGYQRGQCKYSDENVCKELDILVTKAEVYKYATLMYENCLDSQVGSWAERCGPRPLWKDYK